MILGRGAVVVVALDPTIGHEQRGVRPCVVVSDPDVNSDQRFPLICVIPLTGTPGEGLLYPRLSPGASGLAKESYALIDHVRSVDKRRIRRIQGYLPEHEIAAIDDGLLLFLGVSGAQQAADDRLLPEGMSLDEYERNIVVEALRRADGNKSHAARLLGLTRNALRHRLTQMGMEG
jgi:mRNA interferase MazF